MSDLWKGILQTNHQFKPGLTWPVSKKSKCLPSGLSPKNSILK